MTTTAFYAFSLICALRFFSMRGAPLNKLFNWLKDRTERGFFPLWVAKPLLLCSTCMASAWGTTTFLLFHWGLLFEDPFVFFRSLAYTLAITSVMSFSFWSLFNTMFKHAYNCGAEVLYTEPTRRARPNG